MRDVLAQDRDTKRKVEAVNNQWANRIIEQGEASPAALVANPRNWRVHPDNQKAAMRDVLNEVGWVTSVIVNRASGFIVDGHLRAAIAAERGELTIPVQYVDLTDDEEALILATFDPLSALATRDNELLAELLAYIDTDTDAIAELMALTHPLPEIKEKPEYVQEIRSPIYEPSGPKPPVAALYDTGRTAALVAEIDAADIPEDVRLFLRAAAQRHTVLNFDKIANFYAQSSAEVQALMEASALVIIDYKQAIERGYLVLNDSIMEAFDDDYPGAR